MIGIRNKKDPGVLYFQSNTDESANNGIFGSFTIEDYNRVLDEVQVLNPGDDPQTLERLLNEAVTQMESESPRFTYKIEDCSPIPNFMRSDQRLEIANLIRNSIPKKE